MVTTLTSNSRIRALVRSLISNKIFRQAMELIGWQAIVKAISFFTTAWMIRCMGPENLGVSGLILATASALLVFANLGMDIVGTRRIADSKETSKRLVETIMGLRWRIASFLSLLFAGYSVYLLLTNQKFFLAWLLGAVYIFTSALNTNWILQGIEELPLQNRIMSLTAVLAAAAYVLLFHPGMPAGSDIAVLTATNIVGQWLMWRHVKKKTGASIFGRFEFLEAKSLVYESRWAFAVVCTLFVNTQLDMILLAQLSNFEQAGAYRAAASLISPLTLLVTISGSLLYPRFVVWLKQDPQQMWLRQKKIALVYLSAGSVGVGVLFLIAPYLVNLLFGERFDAALWPFLILFAQRIEVLVGGIFAWGIMASGGDKLFLIASFVAAVFSFGFNIYCIPHYGAIAAAAVSFAAEGIVASLTMYFCWLRYSRKLVVETIQK